MPNGALDEWNVPLFLCTAIPHWISGSKIIHMLFKVNLVQQASSQHMTSLAWSLGPVYTTVEKSTGHENKGVSRLWLVENATLDRWVFTLGEENNGGELFSWMIKW
jgi:hypothetical protein